MKTIKASILLVSLVAPFSLADEMPQSGFMTDYSQLERAEEAPNVWRYLAPGGTERIAAYNAVMIDQPEILIAEDSDYRGGKPRHMEALAETFREGLIDALSQDYTIVEEPGPNVMYASMALSDVHLKKKKKRLIGYTPIGLVGGAVAGAATSDLAKKADLESAVLEFEVFDSTSEERIVAVIDTRGYDLEAPTNWAEVAIVADSYGLLALCRLNNSKFEMDMRKDCIAEHVKRMQASQAE